MDILRGGNSVNLEIEFKNMLTYEQYDALKKEYFNDDMPFTQTNFYMDTDDFRLKRNRVALRVRDTGQKKEMTLKVPQTIGNMEYNVPLDDFDFTQETYAISELPEPIQQELVQLHIHAPVKVFGALSTDRLETRYESGLLVLDKSHYLDTEDYELEYEVDDYDNGKVIFDNLLEEHKIEHTDTLTKVGRFYRHLTHLQAKNF